MPLAQYFQFAKELQIKKVNPKEINKIERVVLQTFNETKSREH